MSIAEGERSEAYRHLIDEYIEHQSWRCGHPDRYSQDPDCPCGLLAKLDAAGIDASPWRVPTDA